MDVLRRAAALAEEHLAGIGDRRVGSSSSYEDAGSRGITCSRRAG